MTLPSQWTSEEMAAHLGDAKKYASPIEFFNLVSNQFDYHPSSTRGIYRVRGSYGISLSMNQGGDMVASIREMDFNHPTWTVILSNKWGLYRWQNDNHRPTRIEFMKLQLVI